MKKFFATIFMMAMAIALVPAQNVEYSARAGLNLSNHVGSDSDMNIKAGMNIGVFADIHFNDLFFLQPGFAFSMKGSKNKISVRQNNEYAKTSLKFNLNYLEIPVSLGIKVDLKRDISLRFHTGPYFALGVAGKIKTDVGIAVEGFDFEGSGSVNAFGNDLFRRGDVGWNFGAGVRTGQIYTGIQYGIGFVDAIQYSKIHNGNFSINLGYYF